jgi:hypothetical protein
VTLKKLNLDPFLFHDLGHDRCRQEGLGALAVLYARAQLPPLSAAREEAPPGSAPEASMVHDYNPVHGPLGSAALEQAAVGARRAPLGPAWWFAIVRVRAAAGLSQPALAAAELQARSELVFATAAFRVGDPVPLTADLPRQVVGA